MVPDFRISLPDPVDGKRRRLCELKSIQCCPSRYRPGQKQKAVDRRAGLLQGEYVKKARDIDRDFVGVQIGEGPVERKLQQFGEVHGLVMGAFSEASEDMHNLIQAMAESRVATVDLQTEHHGSGEREDISVVIGQLRRRLSVATVRANINCLLARLSLVGEGTRPAMRRRQWQKKEELQMRQEMVAQWHRKIRGHGITHRGEFFLA